jgi:hypothetical protein
MLSRYRRAKEMSRYNSNYGSHDQLQDLRKAVMAALREVDQLKKLVRMMSHFDICTSARIECNICAEARQAYAKTFES